MKSFSFSFEFEYIVCVSGLFLVIAYIVDG